MKTSRFVFALMLCLSLVLCAVIFSTVLKNTDAMAVPKGQTLHENEFRQIQTGVSGNLRKICWIGNQTGWGVGEDGAFIKTTNNGETWDPAGPGFGGDLYGLDWQKNSDGLFRRGVAAGEGGILFFTPDGGDNWGTLMPFTQHTLHDIFFGWSPETQKSYGYAVGDKSSVGFSPDGSIWMYQNTEYHNENFYRLYFLNNTDGWIAGQNGVLYQTQNGGTKWNYREGDHSNPDYFGIYFFNTNKGWLVGSGGSIFYTFTNGDKWKPQQSNTTSTLYDVLFHDIDHGWAAGASGAVLNTSNGGVNWNPIDIGYSGALYDVSFDDRGYVWLAGANGSLFTNAPPPVQIPTVTLSRHQLTFGAVANGPVSNRVWIFATAMTNIKVLLAVKCDEPIWMDVHGNKFYNNGYFSVQVKPGDLPAGTYNGSVTVSAPQADPPEQQVNVTVNVYAPGTTQSPFGDFSTPVDGSTVSGSVPVTGWALDDVGLDWIAVHGFSGKHEVFFGDAALVEGARPDVEQAYPGYPDNHKAGWGYMLLTNFLPDGVYTLTATAMDVEGHSVSLGSKTITVNNAHAVKPFGAIDTPTDGGTASGKQFINWGWVLTPMPNSIPPDGSTIDVYIDGMPAGHPTYNIYRSDIAALFPGYSNNQGAAGYFLLDTQQYSNGVHSIAWTASDDAGNSDGIGSRYFTITNSSNPDPVSDRSSLNYGSTSGQRLRSGRNTVLTDDGSNVTTTPYTRAFRVENASSGELTWQVSADREWISLEPLSGTGTGWVYVTIDPQGLAAGQHDGVVTLAEINDANPPKDVKINLAVMDTTAAPFGEFDYPDSGRVVSGVIDLIGWALDDIGVKSITIYRQDGDGRIPVGEACMVEGARPAVRNFFSRYPDCYNAGWVFPLMTNTLTDGSHTFIAEITDFEGKTTAITSAPFIVDNSSAVVPFGAIETPQPGAVVAGENYTVAGWILTPPPATVPFDGSTISIYVDGAAVGHPDYNIYRQDIAELFSGYMNCNGAFATFTLNTTLYADGVHTLWWSVIDDQGHSSEKIGSRQFLVKNHSIVTDVNAEAMIPGSTDLLPAFPNPFNPSTTIICHLSTNSRTSLMIFDMAGRQISCLLQDEFRAAGSYRIDWNGRDRYGSVVSSGIYFAVMKANDNLKIRKLLLLK